MVHWTVLSPEAASLEAFISPGVLKSLYFAQRNPLACGLEKRWVGGTSGPVTVHCGIVIDVARCCMLFKVVVD